MSKNERQPSLVVDTLRNLKTDCTLSDISKGDCLIRIGATGHRILAEPEKIEAGVEQALRRIEQAFPGERLTIISALAEGADRIAARQVLARPGAGLVVALPLPKSDYLNDFKSKPSRTEFSSLLQRADQVVEMFSGTTREEAYEAAGEYVLNHADVLITVWDGQNAQGRGGTGDIVARARERHLPIAWIHAGNREPGTHKPTSLGVEQGRVTFENIWPEGQDPEAPNI